MFFRSCALKRTVQCTRTAQTADDAHSWDAAREPRAIGRTAHDERKLIHISLRENIYKVDDF